MSEESRLGREAIETAYALKQLVQAGVRVFFYLEDRERTLDSPTDKIMLSLTTFADELEREKARQRTYDDMQRKARAGHVTGGRVFGYDNVEIVWNQSRKRDTWGRSQRSERPEDAWLHVPAPELRIVSADIWAASQRERSKREAQYSMSLATKKGLPHVGQFGGGAVSSDGPFAVIGFPFPSRWRRGGVHEPFAAYGQFRGGLLSL